MVVSAVADGSYLDQPSTVTDGQLKLIFGSHSKQFIQLLIYNLNERFPDDARSAMTSLDVILNPHLLLRAMADVAFYGKDSLNTII